MAHNRAAGRMAEGSPVVNEDGSGEQKVKMPTLNPNNLDGTIEDAQLVQAGAMAPDDPSGQDYAVAGQAKAIMSQAMAMKSQQQQGGGESGAQQAAASGSQQPDFQRPQFSMQA